MALLELESVSSGYAGSMVIHDVSLNVEEGQVTALLGRNGVGKTTTLRTIVGLLDVQTGRIRYDGTDITGLEPL
jgi:branched-chain amino acid transport system ATP-binding protein